MTEKLTTEPIDDRIELVDFAIYLEGSRMFSPEQVAALVGYKDLCLKEEDIRLARKESEATFSVLGLDVEISGSNVTRVGKVEK